MPTLHYPTQAGISKHALGPSHFTTILGFRQFIPDYVRVHWAVTPVSTRPKTPGLQGSPYASDRRDDSRNARKSDILERESYFW
jgi:hypothetical protein